MFIKGHNSSVIKGVRMNKFIKDKLHLIIVGLILVVFAVIAVFGMGGTNLPSTYYQTGGFDVESGYNALIYKIDYSSKDSSEERTLDSVWLSVGSADYSSENSSVNFISGLASSQSGSFRQIKSKNYVNDVSNPKSGEWICVASATDVESYSSRSYYALCVSVDVNVKLNELVFIGNDNGEKVILPVTAIGSGIKSSFASSLDNSDEFARDEVAVDFANVLIDESATFDLNKIVDGVYEGEFISGEEALILESVRNLTSGRGYYVSNSANPLGFYLISLGTAIFGHNALGLRIIPLLFSIANIVLLYFIGNLCFGNKWSGVLLSALYVLGGYSLSFATMSSVNAILLTLILLAFYAFYKFVRKGISNKTPAKSYLNLLLGGLFLAIAISVKSQAIYVGIALLGMFVFGMIRQYKAYANRKSESDNKSKEKDLYVRKAIFTLICGVIAFVVLPLVVLGVSFLFGYKTFSGLYNATGLFSYVFAHFGKGLTDNGTSSVIGWVVNFEAQTLSANKYAFGNMILTFINLFALLYGLCHVILLFTEKKSIPLSASVKFGVIMPYIILAGTFLLSYLMNFIGGGVIGDFYISSVFMSAITVGLITAFDKENVKPLFSMGKVSVTVTKLIVTIILLVMAIAFALAVPAFIGLEVNSSIYSWNVLLGIAG